MVRLAESRVKALLLLRDRAHRPGRAREHAPPEAEKHALRRAGAGADSVQCDHIRTPLLRLFFSGTKSV